MFRKIRGSFLVFQHNCFLAIEKWATKRERVTLDRILKLAGYEEFIKYKK